MTVVSREQLITGWKRWEKTFLSVEFMVLSLLAFILYLDFSARLDAGTREQIGVITFKQKTVQRKYSDRTVWEPMESSFPLFNRDSIRTGDLSDAEITLNDGTKLEIDENTLILLNISKEEKEIDFAYGSISAKRSDVEVGGSGDFAIRSGDQVISLDKADVNLAKNEEKSLTIDVKSGIANLLVGNEKQEITTEDKVVVSGKDIEVTKKPFRVLFPPSNYRLVSSGQKIELEYSIDGYSPEDKAVIEFSRSRDFSNVFFRRPVTAEKFKESFSSGVYYWRGMAQGKVASVGKVTLVSVSPPRPVSPGPNARFFAPNRTTMVSFSWMKDEGVSQSYLQLAKDAQFQNLVVDKNTFGSSLSLDLEPGEYYWRVKGIVSEGVEPLVSASQSFAVTLDEPKNPPGLLHPKSGDLFSDTLVAQGGVSFFWSQIKGYVDYEVEISQKMDFSDPIRFLSQGKTNQIYRGNLGIGEYYWRVRGIAPSGARGNFSSHSVFSVTAIAKNVFNLQSDSVVSTAEASKEGLTLKWKKLPINGTYEVLLAKDKEFKHVVKRILTNLSQAQIQEITSGKYFWKVSLLDDNGKPTMVSDYRELEVSDASLPLFPKNGQVVNMTQRDDLKFEWQPRPGISNYTIILYQKLGSDKKQVLQKSTSTAFFLMNEIELLDKGDFVWEIYFEEAGQRRLDFVADFKIDLDPLPERIELLTPKVQYAE